MNYILKLQEENKILKEKLAQIEIAMSDFQVFLNSEKFVGVDTYGERKDWIGTSDVLHWLRETKSLTY